MSVRKINSVFLLALLTLAAALVFGCQPEGDFPFYQMEAQEDDSESFCIDGIQYSRDWNQDEDGQAFYFHPNDKYIWTPVEGIGEQIGVCGTEPGSGKRLDIFEIAGDKGRFFLYTQPASFYFGGTDGRLWRQEGITLETPAAETVASISIIPEKGAPAEVDDPAMTAALLEVYNGGSAQSPKIEGWAVGLLSMHHKAFPFLQYTVECCCSPELPAAYCKNKSGKWSVLPVKWYEVISECLLPARADTPESQR